LLDLKGIRAEEEKASYLLGTDFFAGRDESPIKDGNVRVDVLVKKVAGDFKLTFSSQGSVVVTCDRCLDDLSVPVDAESSLVVKFGPEYRDDGDDVVIVDEKEGTLDLADLLYQLVALELPLQHMHAEGECNPDMLNVLKAHSMEAEAGKEAATDPRWDELKKIIDNN